MMTKRRITIVGGGASGLFAAIRASNLDAEVVVFEKMPRPARKLRITGKGRCNLTNIVPIDRFIEHFGRNGQFLHSAFSRFCSDDLIEFLSNIGIETVVERGGRVFPKDSDAKFVVDKLVEHASKLGVRIICESSVTNLIMESGLIDGVISDSERRGKVIHFSD